MSSRNGDRSRFHRIRKQKLARRIRTKELVHPAETPGKGTEKAASTKPVTA
jgi:hypothetical protein